MNRKFNSEVQETVLERASEYLASNGALWIALVMAVIFMIGVWKQLLPLLESAAKVAGHE